MVIRSLTNAVTHSATPLFCGRFPVVVVLSLNPPPPSFRGVTSPRIPDVMPPYDALAIPSVRLAGECIADESPTRGLGKHGSTVAKTSEHLHRFRRVASVDRLVEEFEQRAVG